MRQLGFGTIAMFIIEGMRFGRGLGALDLNKDRMEDYMHILDPGRLSQEQAGRICNAFKPIRSRKVLEVADELEQADRQAFDDCILETYRIAVELERIYDSFRALVSIRQTAVEE